VKTVGIDLASQPENTGICLIDWSVSPPSIRVLDSGADDDRIAQVVESADKIGVDIPFGWPSDFVAAVHSYHSGLGWPGVRSEKLRLRECDRWIKEKMRLNPLSVSSDKIAIPAFRAARLLTGIYPNFRRNGTGPFVEVYPAAALKVWGLPYREYKKNKPEHLRNRELIISGIKQKCGEWFVLPERERQVMLKCADALDAFVCALIARASERGLVHEIPEELKIVAKVEGWIALPLVNSLSKLVEQTASPSA
jgi:predicted nuclease with RNAse H fold